MDTDQLRTFDRVVRDGSFTKAAARLNVTQAAVSMRIRALEDALSGPLFTRGRKVKLTERGQTFLPYARRMLSALVEGEDAMRGIERGRIAIGSLTSLIGPLLAPALVAFAGDHPGVEFSVQEGHHRHVAEWLHDRAVDLAIIAWPNLDPLLDHIEPIAVFREKAMLVAAPALAARIGGEPTLDRIFQVAPQFLLLNWWQVMPDAIAALRARARTTSVVSSEAGRVLIDSGSAVGHLLETRIRVDLANGTLADLAPIDAPPAHRDSALVATEPDAASRPLLVELSERIQARAHELGILLPKVAAPPPTGGP